MTRLAGSPQCAFGVAYPVLARELSCLALLTQGGVRQRVVRPGEQQPEQGDRDGERLDGPLGQALGPREMTSGFADGGRRRPHRDG